MRRSSLNFVVDLVSFLDLLGLAFTGAIMKFVLPPGSSGVGRQLHAGRGGEHIRQFWSMGRHEWGGIHFYLALIFLVLMAVHVVLHWAWIKNHVRLLLTGTRRDG